MHLPHVETMSEAQWSLRCQSLPVSPTPRIWFPREEGGSSSWAGTAVHCTGPRVSSGKHNLVWAAPAPAP